MPYFNSIIFKIENVEYINLANNNNEPQVVTLTPIISNQMPQNDYLTFSILLVLTNAISIFKSIKSCILLSKLEKSISVLLFVILIEFGFLCVSIFAFLNSVKCRKANNYNDYIKAFKYSKKALWYNLFIIYVWLILILIVQVLSLLISISLTNNLG